MEKNHYSFIQAIQQTPCDHSLQRSIPAGFEDILEPDKPINPFHPQMIGETRDSLGFGLMSCTESLGSESSEEMTPNLDVRSNSSSSCCSSGNCRRRESQWRSEKKNFPPPLTSLSENGRRNFTLNSVRKDGRLEIVGVMIERPEMLCANRKNGRLRLFLVQTSIRDNNDDDNDNNDEEAEEEEEEGEGEGEAAEEEEEREEWKVVTTPTAAATRRCYNMREMHGVWGQQHGRYVTTM